jgi:hypothetical protein
MAVDKLNEAEIARLRTFLMARIPGKWKEADINDISILSQIGDEDTADKLERMYAIDPHQRLNGISRTEAVHNSVATIRNRFKSRAFETAADPFVIGDERIHAALRLDEADRGRLQSIVLKRLRLAQWDASTSGDLDILGAIGTEEAAKEVESFYNRPDYRGGGGMSNTLLHWVVFEIRKRELPTTTRFLTPADEDELSSYP